MLAVYLHFQTVIIKGNCRFDTNLFWYKSFLYELKHWNCSKNVSTSSTVCAWTRKTFREIILHSLSQVHETIYNSIEQIFIKQIVPKRLFIATTVYLIKSTMFILMEPLACQAFHLTCPGGMCHMLKGCVFRLQQALGFRVMRNFARYCALNRCVKQCSIITWCYCYCSFRNPCLAEHHKSLGNGMANSVRWKGKKTREKKNQKIIKKRGRKNVTSPGNQGWNALFGGKKPNLSTTLSQVEHLACFWCQWQIKAPNVWVFGYFLSVSTCLLSKKRYACYIFLDL